MTSSDWKSVCRVLPGCLLLVMALTGCQPKATSEAASGPPDFTGTWMPQARRAAPWPDPLPLTPTARTAMANFNPEGHDPTRFCMPFGTPRNMLQTEFPLEIVQTPARVVMVWQPNLSNSEVRRIPVDGSPLPQSPDPSWFGTSRGRWEGSTLVIETIGLRPDALIDGKGISHSAGLRVVERLSVVNDAELGKVMINDMELHDAQAYTQPLKTRRYFVSAPQAHFGDSSCSERRWIEKLWHDRLQEHSQAARGAKKAK